jgi:hypothetical protein
MKNAFAEVKVNLRIILISFALLLPACPSWAQPARKPQEPAQVPSARELSPDEIIKAFSDKETEFYEAWKQYTYQQLAEVKVTEVDGRPISNERLIMAWEVVFRDDGTRENRLVDRRGRLKNVQFTADDEEVISDIQPFALTSKDLTLYNVKYDGKEKIDELDCYVFTVKPKSTKGGRMYFDGRIWVDAQDLQIVRTVGKAVPQTRESQFPEFETIRQVVDNKYWFPVWTHADSKLRFPGQTVRVEETITYENYKRFGSKANIKFGEPPAEPTKPPGN